MNKAVPAFRADGGFKHEAELHKAQRKYMRGRIIAEGNARNSKVGQTVFCPGKENDLAAIIIRLCEERFGLTRSRVTKAA